ncbi:MFS transporter [Nonomuraea cavernae]|uniref:MFS transporter n=1 Tax=Nonomuraea cavernae TaxID=2045107 RepID=UPI0033E710DF
MTRLLRLLDLVPQGLLARRLIVLTLVHSVGNGLFLTSSAVFFVKVVGLRPGEIGVGLSVAGLAGFLATAPVGRLTDRVGARRLLAVNHGALALLFCLYPLVGDLRTFIVIAALISVCEMSGMPLHAALIHSVFPRGETVRVTAQLRSAFNAGYAVGAAVAGVAIATASPAVFFTICAANALAQASCVLIVLRLPEGERPARTGDGRPSAWIGSALRDVRFLIVTLGNGLLELHTTVLLVGIPLWIVSRTEVPPSLIAVLVITNTVIVLLLQVRLSKGAETVAGAARMVRRAGLWLAAGCLVCLAGQGGGAVAGTVALLAGTVILSVGEIVQSAGAWGLAFELPPPGRQGEYQGVFALGRGVQQLAGPALVTALLVGAGAFGWLALAVLFAALGFCVHGVIRGRT